MGSSLALQLTSTLYNLSELEFFNPEQSFEDEKVAVSGLIDSVITLQAEEFHSFAREMASEISQYCNDSRRDPSALYSAFDRVDEILAIDYSERAGFALGSSERLYECSGAKVQTSYSSIFQVLEYLKLPADSHLIDLGSGFGRVGLGVGLWRNDLHFTGYEYVANRVTASNHAAERAGISDRVRFFCQDLSDSSFEIPVANAYYLYDPFSKSTYLKVVARLMEIGMTREIFVIAKGAASDYFKYLDSWSLLESLDHGNLQIFQSQLKIARR